MSITESGDNRLKGVFRWLSGKASKIRLEGALRVYRGLLDRSSEIAKDPERLKRLIEDTWKKALRHKKALREVWDDLDALIRLLTKWYQGEYKEVPWQFITSVVAALLYVLNPLDFIPDFIPGAGFIDDGTVIAYVVTRFKGEIERFKAWESSRPRRDA